MLSALSSLGSWLLLGLVMDLQDPAWSRPAIALQLLAPALAGAALGARWRLSRRFVIYPLVLAAVIYLWDTTLPPPSLPDGLVRVVVPRLALSRDRHRCHPPPVQAACSGSHCACARAARAAIHAASNTTLRHSSIQQELVPLDELAHILHVGTDELRARLRRLVACRWCKPGAITSGWTICSSS